uniref:ROK family transcriptional regulator n=1 Tax=Pelomonas sp. KK5 TaxID=1855730 RepID=UPI001E39EE30
AAADPANLPPRGSNSSGLGQFNERVVLQAIRLHGSLPKAEIARLTHLTAQTVQVIIARLEAEDMVQRLEPVRGKVGQPSVPMALNPDGAFSFGIKIGRRSLDLLLVDFCGQVRQRRSLRYDWPDPDAIFDEIRIGLSQLSATLPARLRGRLHGVGVAAPLALDGWQALLGVAPEQAARWAGIDIRERIATMTRLPVQFVKDTAAACVAELLMGHGRSLGSFLYIFLDTFIGGGLVLDSQLRVGPHGNAGAIGSMQLGAKAGAPQLLSSASLFNLEARFGEQGLDSEAVYDARALEGDWAPLTRAWLREVSPAIAHAIHGAVCLLDIDQVVIDGNCAPVLLAALTAELERAMDKGCNWEGVARPVLVAGTVGADARAIGGALLPLYANYGPDRELFLKVAG